MITPVGQQKICAPEDLACEVAASVVHPNRNMRVMGVHHSVLATPIKTACALV